MISRSKTAPGMIGLPGKCPSVAVWFAAKCKVIDPLAVALSITVTSFPRLRDQTPNVLARKLAQRVARQRRYEAQRSRQKSNVDAPAQLAEDVFGTPFWCHNEGDQPIDRAC